MPTVRELSDPYANFMLNPLGPDTADVCSVCLTFTDGFQTCFRCNQDQQHLDAVLPISYSVHFGQLHTVLAGYKRSRHLSARRFQADLAAVLWRFLRRHENCLAEETGVDIFDVVTTVPSSSMDRDPQHPLPRIVGEVVRPTVDRYERVLRRTDTEVPDRTVDPVKYETDQDLTERSVLLIDDTWTTGANAQSAAAALKAAGAGSVGLVVIGRHVHDDFGGNDERLRALPRPFTWESCAYD